MAVWFRYALAFSLLLAIAPILIALILVFQKQHHLERGGGRCARCRADPVSASRHHRALCRVVFQRRRADRILGRHFHAGHLLLPCQPQHLFVFVDLGPGGEGQGACGLYPSRGRHSLSLTVYFALYLCAFYFLVVVFERLWLIVVAFLAVLLFMCMYRAPFVLPPADNVWHRRIAVQRMFLRHPGRCIDQDAGDIHFLFHRSHRT